jgi:hypothetical protein
LIYAGLDGLAAHAAAFGREALFGLGVLSWRGPGGELVQFRLAQPGQARVGE